MQAGSESQGVAASLGLGFLEVHAASLQLSDAEKMQHSVEKQGVLQWHGAEVG